MSTSSHLQKLIDQTAANGPLKAAMEEAHAAHLAHGSATYALKARLSKLEAQLAAHRTALLLDGDTEAAPEPNFAELERARADLLIAPTIDKDLERRYEVAGEAWLSGAAKQRMATGDAINIEGLTPAYFEVHSALDSLRAALAKLMAAHHLVAHEFGPKRLTNTAAQWYGPAAELLQQLQALPWPKHPYSLEPTWIRSFERHLPFQITGCAEAKTAIIDDLNRKLAEAAA